MDELLDQFLIEGRELAAEAERSLDLLIADPADRQALDRTFRAIHTLKGSVAIFDMDPAERVLHAAEDILSLVQKGSQALTPSIIEALVAVNDQVQQWIDELEQEGKIDDRAGELSNWLIERLGVGATTSGRSEIRKTDDQLASQPWAQSLRQRSAAIIDANDGPLVAFRYTPDADCFFRGEDPLKQVAAVPDLVWLDIAPIEEDWPALDDWDPFRCFVTLEGLSSASLEDVQAEFRLAADQVSIVTIVPSRPAPLSAKNGLQEGKGERVLRVGAARIDALADGVGDLLVATNSLDHLARRADMVDASLAASIRACQTEIGRVAAELSRTATSIRMVRLAPSLQRLPRLVREIASDLGKSVRFSMTGTTIEVDKDIADALFEPLLHLVRNALDHGIEPADTRVKAGKSEEGHLRLSVSREGDQLVVSVADDGSGIDPSRVREAAIKRNLIDREAARALSDEQALQLIFEAGFSTAAAVTDVSGRGVGMDAVRAAIDRLRGQIDVESRAGEGSEFKLRFPLNAITTKLLTIYLGDDQFCVPLEQIVETAGVPANLIHPVGQGQACVLRDQTIPVLDLAALFDVPRRASSLARLIVTEVAGAPVAIRIDAFGERIDALVHERKGLLRAVPGLSGTMRTGDGSVRLVLNLAELVG